MTSINDGDSLRAVLFRYLCIGMLCDTEMKACFALCKQVDTGLALRYRGDEACSHNHPMIELLLLTLPTIQMSENVLSGILII